MNVLEARAAIASGNNHVRIKNEHMRRPGKLIACSAKGRATVQYASREYNVNIGEVISWNPSAIEKQMSTLAAVGVRQAEALDSAVERIMPAIAKRANLKHQPPNETTAYVSQTLLKIGDAEPVTVDLSQPVNRIADLAAEDDQPADAEPDASTDVDAIDPPGELSSADLAQNGNGATETPRQATIPAGTDQNASAPPIAAVMRPEAKQKPKLWVLFDVNAWAVMCKRRNGNVRGFLSSDPETVARYAVRYTTGSSAVQARSQYAEPSLMIISEDEGYERLLYPDQFRKSDAIAAAAGNDSSIDADISDIKSIDEQIAALQERRKAIVTKLQAKREAIAKALEGIA
jgi:hypothetical protein